MRSDDAVGAVCAVFVAIIDAAGRGGGSVWFVVWERRSRILQLLFSFSPSGTCVSATYIFLVWSVVEAYEPWIVLVACPPPEFLLH